MRTEMDVLILENQILLKQKQTQKVSDNDWENEFELD